MITHDNENGSCEMGEYIFACIKQYKHVIIACVIQGSASHTRVSGSRTTVRGGRVGGGRVRGW